MVSETIKTFEPTKLSIIDDPDEWIEAAFTHFLEGWFGHSIYDRTGMRWLANVETTEMIVTSKKPMIDDVDKNPHLVVLMGGSQWSGIGLDQMQELRMGTGTRRHTDLIPGTVTYHAQAKDGSLARRIAHHAAFGTIVLRRMIMRGAGLHDVSPRLQKSAESPPTAIVGTNVNADIVEVSVAVPFYWQPRWRITNPAPTLRQIRANLMVRDRFIVSAEGALSEDSVVLSQEVVSDQT